MYLWMYLWTSCMDNICSPKNNHLGIERCKMVFRVFYSRENDIRHDVVWRHRRIHDCLRNSLRRDLRGAFEPRSLVECWSSCCRFLRNSSLALRNSSLALRNSSLFAHDASISAISWPCLSTCSARASAISFLVRL